MVTHDLRAPLASMNINLSALVAGTYGKLTQNVSTLLQSINTQMSRLMELVTELLEVQKLESAAPTLNKECLSVFEIINEARETVRAISDLSKIEIAPFRDDAAVLGDEREFTRIVSNVLLYAASHAEPQSTISFALAHKDGSVKITLTYSGPAPSIGKDIFSLKELSQVVRLMNAPTKDARFTLAIARILTEAHGGQIGIESGEKEQSIWLTVPEFHEEGEVPDEEL
jgi:K+-sensing histidine kinase KdpD